MDSNSTLVAKCPSPDFQELPCLTLVPVLKQDTYLYFCKSQDKIDSCF